MNSVGQNGKIKIVDITLIVWEKMTKIKVVDLPHTERLAIPLLGRPLIRHDMESQFLSKSKRNRQKQCKELNCYIE